MSDGGHMIWRLWIEDHEDWGSIEINAPVGIRAELAGIILTDSSDLLKRVAKAHELLGATIAWEAHTYDAQGRETGRSNGAAGASPADQRPEG